MTNQPVAVDSFDICVQKLVALCHISRCACRHQVHAYGHAGQTMLLLVLLALLCDCVSKSHEHSFREG